jgi:hypothetical protein
MTTTPLLHQLLNELIEFANSEPPKARLKCYRVEIDGVIIEGDIGMVTLKDNQKCRISVMGVSVKNNPAPLDGPVAFAVSDPNLGTLNVIDDTTVEVLAVGPVGNFQVTYSGDAKIGPGEDVKFGLTDFTVVASKAVNLVGTTGPVEDQ